MYQRNDWNIQGMERTSKQGTKDLDMNARFSEFGTKRKEMEGSQWKMNAK